VAFGARLAAPVPSLSAAVAPAAAAVAVSSAALALTALEALGTGSTLCGSIISETLRVASVAASAAVAATRAMAVVEWFTGALAGRGCDVGLLGAEETLQPAEESPGGRRCGRYRMLDLAVRLAPGTGVVLGPFVTRVARLPGFARVAGLAGVARIARLPRLARVAGLALFAPK
jgi:hypothetical protein